jgi:hypothetical protein
MYKSHSRQTYAVSVELKTIPINNLFELGKKISPTKATANNIGIPTRARLRRKNYYSSKITTATVFSKEQ